VEWRQTTLFRRSGYEVDIRALTTSLENGNGNALETALDGKFQEERALVLEQVGALNQKDLTDQKTTATLDIDVAGSKHNANTMSVSRTLPGFHDAFFGGTQLYEERLDLDTGKRDITAKFETS
jgi:hypothetical protein